MAEELCLDAGCVLPTRHDGPCRFKADRHTDSRVSAEDVERGARALYEHEAEGHIDTLGWNGRSDGLRRAYRDKARAVLSSIKAVPKAEHEAEVVRAYRRGIGQAQRGSEARRESYRTALGRLDYLLAAPGGMSPSDVQRAGRAIISAALAVPQEGKPCATCHGTGESVNCCPGAIEDCEDCGGTGLAEQEGKPR